MSELPKYLQRLDEALFDLPEATDGMLLAEVDGFLTGIALCPQEIPPEDWLPHIWRPDPETPEYLYHDTGLLAEIAYLAKRHLRALARDLHKGEFAPLYDLDERNGDLIWEFWVEGFDRALALRPDAFLGIDEAEIDEKAAFLGLRLLSVLADAPENGGRARDLEEERDDAEPEPNEEALPRMSREERAAMIEEAPDLIPAFVETLYEWTRLQRPTPDFAVPIRATKVGRNDPCPCGSGKKHKKCCGAA